MSATVALVGRPNVGKSTLFNKLTKSRDALVADVPGLTRDRRYGKWKIDDEQVNLIDTGGLFGDHALVDVLTEQTRLAVAEADAVLLVLDGREGLTAADEDVIAYLRRSNVDFVAIINKIDGVNEDEIIAEFARSGLSDAIQVSATHSRGLLQLTEGIKQKLDELDLWARPASVDEISARVIVGVKVAIVGRPNVGKSTLVNRLLGEDRQVVFDMPGTTKDAIDIPFEREGSQYVLIDTAGVRRKGRVDEVTEKFSVVKALDAMQRCHVVVLVIDAREGVVEQDLHVLQYALDAGCAMVIAVNKWDGLDEDQRDQTLRSIERRFTFAPWIPLQRISALHGTGVGHLFDLVDKVYEAGEFDVSTSLLTRLVRNMVDAHPTPSIRGRQIKIKMATHGGAHPPTIIVHGNQLASLPASYKKFLENGFREALNLVGNPVRVDLRDADNPYAGKRNVLTERQQARRQRVIRHRKKR